MKVLCEPKRCFICFLILLISTSYILHPSVALAAAINWTGGIQPDVTVSGATTINITGDNQVSNITFTANSTLIIQGDGTLNIGTITSSNGQDGTDYTGSGYTGGSSIGTAGKNISVTIDGPTTIINNIKAGDGGRGGTADNGTNDLPDGSGGSSCGGAGGNITVTIQSGHTTIKAITGGSGGQAGTAGNGGVDVRASDSLMTGADGGDSLGGAGGSITLNAAGQLTLPTTIAGGTGGAAGNGGYYTEYSKRKGSPGKSIGGAGGNVVMDLSDSTQLSAVTVTGGAGGVKGTPGYDGYALTAGQISL